MKISILIALIAFLAFTPKASAYDPTSITNNKYGIHILVASELQNAARLVNSSGGDWGYVTIPIQSGDKDLKKWQAFMDECRKLHLIPILRLATEGDFFNTTVWRKPEASDVLDFSNFLSSLSWPTQNRYVIVFNEVNRADEWGGSVNPSEYAQLLTYSVSVFKSQSKDFFIISAGMDNASQDFSVGDMNEYTYFSRMNAEVPGIFNQVDGISSHSYPNPGFSVPSSVLTTRAIDTFYYEKQFIQRISSKNLPVFITETGWDAEKIPTVQVASYYKDAFQNVWDDPSVVAVTPFLLQAGAGPFQKFSLLDTSGNPNDIHKAIWETPKASGTPLISPERKVLSSKDTAPLPIKDFKSKLEKTSRKVKEAEKMIRFLFQL